MVKSTGLFALIFFLISIVNYSYAADSLSNSLSSPIDHDIEDTNNIVAPNSTIVQAPYLNMNILPIAHPQGGLVTDTSISWGGMYPGVIKTAILRLQVNTNSSAGYIIYIKQNHNMVLKENPQIDIDGVANVYQGTNNYPVIWTSPPGLIAGTQTGHLGYSTTDSSLNPVGDGTNRFQSGRKYASLTTVAEEILFHNGPVHSFIEGVSQADIILRLEINKQQAAGSYSNQLIFVAKPLF